MMTLDGIAVSICGTQRAKTIEGYDIILRSKRKRYVFGEVHIVCDCVLAYKFYDN